MEKYCGCLAFDGDDTLWYNAHKYRLLMIQCLEIICRDFGVDCPNLTKILLVYEEIDKKNVMTFGFKKERTPTSWVQTYRKFCAEFSREPKSKIEKKLYQTAVKFWQPPFPLKKGVPKILNTFKKKGFYLVLLTVGEKEVQQKKIDSTKIAKYFHEVRIVSDDKSPVLAELALKFGQDKVWMVGDSKRLDVAAAIKAGVKVFYIASIVWDYFDWQCDPEIYKKYVTELKDIKELLEIF